MEYWKTRQDSKKKKKSLANKMVICDLCILRYKPSTTLLLGYI